MKYQIKRVSVGREWIGYRLAKDVISDKQILLAQGIELTEKDVVSLGNWSIDQVWLKVPYIEPEVVYQECIAEVEKLYGDVRAGKPLDQRGIAQRVNSLVEKVLEEGKNLESLSHLSLFDKYTFQHCVNVCVFATLIGKNLGYELPALLSLGTAALLHDIGKCFVPNEIINKEGPLDGEEMKIMQTHPQRGLRYLEREGYSDEVCLAAFQHHERIDGGGYPLGITAEKMHPFSSIIAVADYYDALTTDRSYRKALTPLEALGIMKERGGKTFSEEIFRVFLRGLEMFPVGVRLLLDTGDQAAVISGDDTHQFLVELMGAKVPYGAVGARVVDVLL